VDADQDARPTRSLDVSLAAVQAGIRASCRRSGRSPDQVLLVAVTKTVPLEVVEEARRLGLTDFAENHANELAPKAQALPARWHFIGKLQRGTAARIADHADVVQSAVPGGALERVANRAAGKGKLIPCLVQIDFTGRRQGVAPEEVDRAVRSAIGLEGIHVVGLMTLPPWSDDPEATRPFFRRLADLRDGLQKRWPQIAELSMGMSADFGVAIEEGATMVRVGTALFGDRPLGPDPSSRAD
jgi:PLP dependent protein